MAFSDCLDAIKVHAEGAAAAANSKFIDVAVRFPAARGKSVSVFYAGERNSVYFDLRSLADEHIAQAVVVRAMWPLPDPAATTGRDIEIEISTYTRELRTRIDGDYTLGGSCTALKMLPGSVETEVVNAKTKYAVIDHEIGIDLDEYPQNP